MRALVLFIVLTLCGTASAQEGFSFRSPGILVPSNSGQGRMGDRYVYLPDLYFPLLVGTANGKHAYCNSQVYGIGGMHGPAGGVNSLTNYRYPWSDNYCEIRRKWNMPLCSVGTGHQGMDCRPNLPERNVHEAVAFSDGQVIQVTPNTTVVIRSNDGTTDCRYLHLDAGSIRVKRGDRVRAGELIGKVSNIMGGVPNTSIHLHFDCQRTLSVNGVPMKVFVPIYTSMVLAYHRAWGGASIGSQGQSLQQNFTYERP